MSNGDTRYHDSSIPQYEGLTTTFTYTAVECAHEIDLKSIDNGLTQLVTSYCKKCGKIFDTYTISPQWTVYSTGSNDVAYLNTDNINYTIKADN